MNPTKVDSLKKDLWLISYDFSSDKTNYFRVNSTRKLYLLRKIYPLVSSKPSQYTTTQNLSHPKILHRLGFKNSLKSDLVISCKNNHAKSKDLIACSQ
jgi:hypothetical protein